MRQHVLVSVLGILSVAEALAPAQAVAEEPREQAGDLSVVRPKGWSRTENPAQGTVAFAPPGVPAGAVCAVTFARGQDFPGPPAAWHDAFWKGMTAANKPVAGAAGETVGSFLRTWGEFTPPDGSHVWLCLYTAHSKGKGHGVLFATSSQALFKEHLGTIDAIVKGCALPGETPLSPAEPSKGAAAELADAILVVTPERWGRRDPDKEGVVALIPPQVPPGRTCIALIVPPGNFERDAETFHAEAVKNTTRGSEIEGTPEKDTCGPFISSKLVARQGAVSRWIDIYTAHWGTRVQLILFMADDKALYDFYKSAIGTMCMNGYVPNPLLAPGADVVPVVGIYLAGKLEVENSVDPNDFGLKQRAAQKLLVLFKNGLCLDLDAKSTGQIDSTYEAYGIAGIDAAALLKVRQDRRTGKWTESGGTITAVWTLREAEKFQRVGENLKSGDTLWSRLEPMDGMRLEGTFERRNEFGPPWWIRFGKDGRFEADGVNNTMGGEITMPAFPARGAGTYEIRSLSLILRFANGFRISIHFGYGFDPATVKTLLINGYDFDRKA